MDLSFSSFSDSGITMKVSEGVYYFGNVPVYIVEHIQEQDSEYVLVYAVDSSYKKSGDAVKKYRMESKIKTIQGGTTLSDAIKSKIPKKTVTRKIVDEPLFMANIISQGVDTVTGATGKGFFERQPDSTVLTSKGQEYVPGKYTGVFITLSNIKWRSSYTPIESVIAYYNKQKVERDNVRAESILRG